MPVPPLHDALVQVYQSLAHRRYCGVRPVDPDEDLLHLARRLDQPRYVSTEQRRRHGVLVTHQIGEKGVPERRRTIPRFQPAARLAAFWITGNGRRVLDAQDEFELAKLKRLESAPGLEPVAERQELERCHRLEHVDLR